MKINLRPILTFSTLCQASSVILICLQIFLDLNQIVLFDPNLLGGHASLNTLILITTLALLAYKTPFNVHSKGIFLASGIVFVYALSSLLLGTHIHADLWLSEMTGLFGVWTDDSTLVSIMIISLSIALLNTRAHILGASMAFVASVTPVHLCVTYLISPNYAAGDMAATSALYLFLLSFSLVLRYLSTSTFRRALIHPSGRLYLLLAGSFGFLMQQVFVIRDAIHLSKIDNFELLIISLPFQYLLFKLTMTQIRSYHSVRQYGDSMHRNATVDPLTQCGNRLSLKEELKKLTESSNSKIGVIIFDIDFFKRVNDQYGHETGDNVLRELVAQVTSCLSKNERLIRWGGEEFLIISKNTNTDRLVDIAETTRHAVEKHNFNGLKTIRISLGCSIGDVSRFDQVVSLADNALYFSKSHGRNQTTLADDAFIKMIKQDASDVTILDIEKAVKNRELYFVAHPIYDVLNHEIITIEALIRWRREDEEILAPRVFIEKLNQLILGNPEVRNIINRMKIEFIEGIGDHHPQAAIAFNTTPSEVLSEECALLLSRLIQVCDHFNRKLILEFSETTVNEQINIEQLKHLMFGYKELGLRFSIDYFGSEGNNITLLMNLNIDIIKLAPSIAQNLDKNNNSFKIVSSLWLMLHHLGVDIIVEGIDTEYQHRMFKGFGYRLQQGYLFAQPTALADVGELNKDARYDKSLSGKLMSTNKGSTDEEAKPIISS